jgi:hypothetical protein
MRIIALLLLSGLTASACSAPATRTSDADDSPTYGLSTDYVDWPKVNAETIVRGDDEEDEDGEESVQRTAVEIFADVQGDLGAGSVLVKQTRVLLGETPGEIAQIGVMRRVGGSLNGGWAFEGYEPRTMEKAAIEVSTCVNCHSLQAHNDYLFSERSAVMSASPPAAPAERPGF